MALTAVRALVLDVQLRTLGVPATVTPCGAAPIQTRGLWVTPTTEDLPSGFDARRRAARKVLTFSRAAVPTMPTGTAIAAPELDGGPVRSWKVDGFDWINTEQIRVVVLLDEA